MGGRKKEEWRGRRALRAGKVVNGHKVSPRRDRTRALISGIHHVAHSYGSSLRGAPWHGALGIP